MAYGGDVNRGPFLTTINWVFNAIALVAVILRLASHHWRESQGWKKDDAFIILAMVSWNSSLYQTSSLVPELNTCYAKQAANLARAIYVDITISYGLGRHLEVLLEENPIHAVKLLRLMVILQAIGLWTFTLPKLPVVALLVNIFGRSSKRLAIILYSAVTALILLVIVLTITTFVQCTPVSANWTGKGKCWSKNINLDLGYLAGAYSAFLDFALALYPVLRVSHLQMERSRKILLAGSLSLGFIAGIITAYKLSTISSITNVADPTWATVPLEVWNSVEGTALILAASIPLTRPLLISFFHGFQAFTSRLSSSRASQTTKVSNSSFSRGTNKSSNHKRLPSGEAQNSTDDDILLYENPGFQNHSDVESGHHRQSGSGIYKTVDFVVNSKAMSK
ncbi:hypothetical protein SBOR_0329 [Sclerotinia borealis F-4128]|uniref:Rhodopsin domain-containing protein n=1 Tax=Sclerotinia borealis (strain F-4128) TaxID=1432307 RepID=W9CT54_SCLBF|nr:hypothetical protein SBOR_0329 [Sclerotinia borealis F-4128]